MAIELGDELAKKAREVTHYYPNVRVITGDFEGVELPSEHYDVVYSATAIHWIQSAYRFTKPHKLLKPGGYLAIINTEHVSDEAGDAFFFASHPIFQKYHPGDASIDRQNGFRLPLLKDLQPSEKVDPELFTLESFTIFPETVRYSSQEYVDLLATYSPHLALPYDERVAFLAEVKQLIDHDFGSQMTRRYGMTLTIARKIG